MKFDITDTSGQLTRTAIDFSSTGDNSLIVGIASQTIRIFRMFFYVSVATNIKFWDGPSASGTKFTGTMTFLQGGTYFLDHHGDPWLVTSAGNDFVINQSGTAQISGAIYYRQSVPGVRP